MGNDGKRPLPPRAGMSLPLPPPIDADDGVSRVRMSLSEYVPETTSRDLPVLPAEPWDMDEETDDEDHVFGGSTSALTREGIGPLAAMLPPAPVARAAPPPAAPVRTSPARSLPLPPTQATPRPNLPKAGPREAAPPPRESPIAENRGHRDTVAALRKPRSVRRLPLSPETVTDVLASTPLPPPVQSPVPSRSAATPAPTASPGPPRQAGEQRLPLAAEPSGAHPMPRAPVLPPRAATNSVPTIRTVAGRYEILERIGQGGMGKVYKVSHTQLGKMFALKVIGENLADTAEARELFYREARMASSVNHPNIASVVDFGEDSELGAFMVMEIVEGEPLAKMLHRETRIGVRVACEVILQVADALHYVHGKGIVHCDIKTENIIVSEQASTKRRQMVVKLLDFGLARSLTTGRNSTTLSGTPHYVAPERIRGDAASPSSDIYALGILFYELVTGHVPWDGAVANILHGHLEQQPTSPSKLVPGGLDAALEKLILHALAKYPAERHKDMAAFIYELRTVMDMLGFGRRRRGGPGKRVVIERSKNERDALVTRAFEHCRLPLALLSPQGVVQVANPAFAKFVMGVEVEVEGLPIQSTPLMTAWTSFDNDLTRAVNGHPVRRMLEIEMAGKPAQRLLLWLDVSGEGYVLLGVQPIDLG